MGECDALVPGVFLALLGGFLLYKAVSERSQARLGASLPVSPCGSISEGFIQVAGRATGAATISSLLTGTRCLISIAQVEVFREAGKKKRWETIHREEQTVPFYVEDATGKVWLDPTDAELHLLPDAEYSTEKRQPSGEVRECLEKLGLSPEQLEQRLRDFYEQHVRTQRGLPRRGEANPIGLNPEEIGRAHR